MLSAQRERSSNFTNDETERLIDVISEFKTIVENKQLDGMSVKRKINAWKKISTIFNSNRLNVYRSDKTLKLKYEAVKKSLRKKLGHPKEFLQNGEEPSVTNLLTDIELKLFNILSSNFEPPANRNYNEESDPLTEDMLPNSIGDNEKVTIGETKLEFDIDDTPNDLNITISDTREIKNEHFFNSVNNDIGRSTPLEDHTLRSETDWSKSSSPKPNDPKITTLPKPISSRKVSFVTKAKLELMNLQAGILRLEKENKSILLRNAEQIKEQEDYLKLKILQTQLQGIVSENDRRQEEHVMKMKLLELDIQHKELDLRVKVNELREKEKGTAVENLGDN